MCPDNDIGGHGRIFSAPASLFILKAFMKSLFKLTGETGFAGAVGGMLLRPVAAVVIAGSLSVLTITASLYLFMFAGRTLLPPPPVAGISAARILEPVPMNSLPDSVLPDDAIPVTVLPDTILPITILPVTTIVPRAVAEVPAAIAAPVSIEKTKAERAATTQGDSSIVVAGVFVDPSEDEYENDLVDHHHPEKSDKKSDDSRSTRSSRSDSRSSSESKTERHKDD